MSRDHERTISEKRTDHRKSSASRFAAVLVLSSALSNITHTPNGHREQPVQQRSGTEIAHIMTTVIRNNLPISFNPDKQLLWSPVGAYCPFSRMTTVEIAKRVDGKNHYFEIEQTGTTIGSLVVKFINAIDEVQVNSPYVAPRNQPGSDILTTVGVIRLQGPDHQPSTEIQYRDGELGHIPVGETSYLGC